ncbi:Histidine kinase-, DNA gyrase B-, and HSP90-like ATPase [Duganella sp. CF402]|uniref:sensor histidine kinase n=1 Tax=unclassified Duganella TaxID=2636909 RepID=UPI0008B1436B|nr:MULTISPECIES: sensor histidine kinase [unclassified Duganella]RZT10414.1 histidine kinase/DNA gyrase B/HSP90-like ATPase [Duganella sp. BK701]SEL14102.1 Histidine kinase-, DNA gyrase B-, and HSP90-like ATPase [Duganella sp. CF402]
MRYAPPLLEIDIVTAAIVVLLAVAGVLLWRHQRVQAAQALDEAQRQICRLAASQHSLRDAERRRIARDLHDDLGQHLLALGLDLGALASAHPALRLPLEALQERVGQATRAMRAIVHDLPGEALESGLEGAVQQQIAQFSRLSGIRCRLDAEPDAFAAPDGGIEAVLYRVLQESLSNIVRHAQASEVCVGLCRQEHSLSLTVRDNGAGLPQPTARRGHGLRGIAQRVSEAGGRFDIASTPGAGTALTMSFPIQ